MTLDDLMEAFDDPAVIIKPSKFNDFDIYEKGTDKWIATVSIERGIICVANREGNLQFPVKDLNKAIDKTYRSFNESCEFSKAKNILESAGYLIEKVLVELSDEDIEKAKELLMDEDEYGYSSDYVDAAFEYQHAWISDVKMGSTPAEIAAVVSNFLDSLSDEELEEIGAL